MDVRHFSFVLKNSLNLFFVTHTYIHSLAFIQNYLLCSLTVKSSLCIKEYDAKKTLEFVNSKGEKFDVQTIKGKQFVEVKTSLELCDGFMFPHTNKKCSPKSCAKLHVCRLFLEEKCDFGERCRRPHGFDNTKTQKLLVQHKLDTLSADVLKILFQKILKEHKIEYAKNHSGPNTSDQLSSRTTDR